MCHPDGEIGLFNDAAFKIAPSPGALRHYANRLGLPVAALVAVGWLDGVLGVIIAYAPLIWLAVRFKAGARELQEV